MIKNKTTSMLSGFLGFLLLIHCLLRFENIQNQNYRGSFQYAYDNSLYALDDFITKTLLYKASILYPIISYFSIDFSKDLFAIIPYLLFSLLSFWAVYKLIHKQFGIESVPSVLIMMLVLIYGEFKPLWTVQSELFVNSFPTPTWFAHSLALITIFFLADAKYLLSSVILTITLAFHVKAYWILVPVMGLSILLNSLVSKKNMIWLMFPIGFILWKKITSTHLPLEFSERLQMCNNIIARTTFEDSFNLQPKIDLVIYSLTFLIYFRLIKFVKNSNLIIFLKSVGIVTAGVTIFGYLYTWKLYQIFPNPMLIVISPVRAVFLYGIFFSLLVTNWVLGNNSLSAVQKTLLLLSFAILRFGMPINVILALGIAVVTFVYPLLYKKIFSYEKQQLEKSTYWVIAIAFSMLAIKPVFQRWPSNINMNGFQSLGAWTVRSMDPALFNILLELRNQKSDFILVAIQDRTSAGYITDSYENSPDKTDRFIHNNYANFISRKSAYTGDTANFYFDNQLYSFAVKRRQTVSSFMEDLNRIGEEITDDDSMDVMAHDNVQLLVPNSLKKLINRNKVVKSYPNFSLIKLVSRK